MCQSIILEAIQMTVHDDLLSLIPEFEWIQEPDLREACLRTWETALVQNGLTIESVKAIPFASEVPEGPNIVEHTRMVTQSARALSESLAIAPKAYPRLNISILVAGALLHDIGKLVRGNQWINHVFVGVVLAAAQQVPPEVLHIIATHSREGDLTNRSLEAAILHHADFALYEGLITRLGSGRH
jgi:putative nucleotidyltransferase with HDIG domain